MSAANATTLVQVSPADFDWLERGEPDPDRGLTLPAGGVHSPEDLATVRGIVERLYQQDQPQAWMMVSDGEIVGLCSYARPPQNGEVLLGYGVAPGHQDHEHRHVADAVAAMAEIAAADPAIRTIVVQPAASDTEAHRILAEQGFERAGTLDHPDDGELVRWQKTVRS